MKSFTMLLVGFLSLVSAYAQDTGSDSTRIFVKGNKITNNNFKGTAYLEMLIQPDSLNATSVGSVTFEPGARTRWHYHPGGQILLVISGQGRYQERGQPVKIIKKGDAVKCPPNIEHWHGATASDSMTHIAIGTHTNRGAVVWLKAVSDAEYGK